MIDQSEFIARFLELNPQTDKAQAVSRAMQLFEEADVDKNGSISFAEWCAASANTQQSLTKDVSGVLGFALRKRVQAEYAEQ